jgi:uncharacterized protein (DUF58 family)
MKAWFQPEELSTLSGLEWLARKLAQEALSGLQAGIRLGQGTDFSQYRSYMPGDDLRTVDWKVYARTDKLFIRQSELESQTCWHGLLDASASMGYAEGGISKWQYASLLWAAIFLMLSRQGDPFSLSIIQEDGLRYLPARPGLGQAALALLSDTRPKGKWPDNVPLPVLNGGKSHKFILISDFYENHQELGSFVKSLLPGRNEVVVFQVMGLQEISLDFPDDTLFEEAETGELLETDPLLLQKPYQEQAERFLKETREKLLSWGVRYHLCMAPESPVQALRTFLHSQP